MIIIVFGVPESPRYLYKEGRSEEALQILCDVYDRTPDDPKIAKEQKDVLDALALERIHGEYKWSQLFKRDEVQTGRRVLLAYGMQFMNQIGGINLVVYFVPSALQYNVGLTHNLSQLIGGFVQTMFFFGSLIPTFFLDRLGRRNPMMWGSFGLAISMMMIAVLLSITQARGYSASLEHNTSSASVAFFFTVCPSARAFLIQADGPVVHVHLRRLCELYPMGIRPRDPTSACPRKRHRNRHLFQLALGKSCFHDVILPTHDPLLTGWNHRTSSSSRSRRP